MPTPGRPSRWTSNGSAYIAGTTNSNNFPTTPGSFQPATRGGDEAFVARLGPDGSALVFSTYLGSNGRDSAFGLAINGAGNAYVTGFTTAPTFPNNNAIPCFGTKSTGADVFVVRVDPAGLTLSSCTIIGGAGEDVGNAIAVDPSVDASGNPIGNIWVAGTTTSFDLPRPVGIVPQPFLAGAQDAFVAKLNPTGVVVALTFLGGVRDEEGLAIAVDSGGNVYIAGSTKSADFPTTFNALQPFLNGRTNAFVVKLSPAGDSAAFATFLGGSGDDSANAVAVNPSDSTVYLAGSTNSVDFPVVAPIQGQLAGGFDVFVTKLTAAGDAFVYSTYLGGTNDEEARALAVDVNGIAYVAGSTRSVAFPAVRLVGTGGLLDVFVTQITDVPIIQFTAATYQVDETAGSVTISVQRIGDTTGTATVQFAASNGTATAGSDYGTQGSTTPPSGTLGFGPGQIVATFTIPILNSGSSCEGDETVTLSLSNSELWHRARKPQHVHADHSRHVPLHQLHLTDLHGHREQGPRADLGVALGTDRYPATVQFSTTDWPPWPASTTPVAGQPPSVTSPARREDRQRADHDHQQHHPGRQPVGEPVAERRGGGAAGALALDGRADDRGRRARAARSSSRPR